MKPHTQGRFDVIGKGEFMPTLLAYAGPRHATWFILGKIYPQEAIDPLYVTLRFWEETQFLKEVIEDLFRDLKRSPCIGRISGYLIQMIYGPNDSRFKPDMHGSLVCRIWVIYLLNRSDPILSIHGFLLIVR
jgi:hypothetical protein